LNEEARKGGIQSGRILFLSFCVPHSSFHEAISDPEPLLTGNRHFPIAWSMSSIWCNGEWLETDRYPGAAQDRGAFLGLGLFETMGAFDGKVIFADRHLARLRESGARLGWKIDFPELAEVARECLVRASLAVGRARMRLIVTAGSGPANDLTPGKDRLVWLAALPVGEVPLSVTACVSAWPRNERSALAGMKTACYAENLVALDDARKRGFDEAVFLNTIGQLCEAATANLFLVKGGVLLTPSLDSGCLPGIGREVLCELATSHGFTLEEKPLVRGDLETADEIFLISASRGPMPVSRMDGRNLFVHTRTERLRVCWEVEVERQRHE
jgi:branched-chain amino acid aminotransferase